MLKNNFNDNYREARNTLIKNFKYNHQVITELLKFSTKEDELLTSQALKYNLELQPVKAIFTDANVKCVATYEKFQQCNLVNSPEHVTKRQAHNDGSEDKMKSDKSSFRP